MIALAMKIVGKAKNLETSALMLAGIIGAITLALVVFSTLGNKSAGASGSVVEVAAAFIIVALAISILANALQKLSGMETGLMSVAIAFGVFVGSIIVLGALAAWLPAFEKGLNAVGKVFLYAGAGAVLMGAGIFLVSKGISILAPAVAVLAVGLREIFAVINDNVAATIVVGVIVLAIIAAATIAIIKLAPVLQAIAQTISNVVTAITGSLNKGTTKAKSWISNLSTKGKIAIVALITTLCSAIMASSPQILDTIGNMLIKIIMFLGSIVNKLAFAIVDFLCKLIYAIADAIRMNKNKIANGIIVILLTLVDLIIALLKEIVGGIASMFSSKAGEKVNNFFDGISEGINKYIDDSKAAAIAADQATEGYAEAMGTLTFSTSNFTDKAGNAIDGFTSLFKKDADEQGSIIDDLTGKYDELTESGNKLAFAHDLWGNTSTPEVPDYSEYDDLTNGGKELALFSNMYGSKEEAVAEAEEYGDEVGSAYKDANVDAMGDKDKYYQVQEDNMSSAQQAVIDSEPDTRDAIDKHFNEAAKDEIKKGRQGVYDSTKFTIEGALEYLNGPGKSKYRSAMTELMRAGQIATEKTNEISSPSKVFYQYGEYIVQGLINGIEHDSDGAINSMSTLSQAVISAFGNPLEYVSRIANGDLAYDTSIRPVLDSSALYKGASSIDSMFAKQTVSVNGLTGRLAADIGSLDNSNAEIIAELRALREDMTILGDELSDMQIVMDTGALVGATAGPMDKALGARSIRYGRG